MNAIPVRFTILFLSMPKKNLTKEISSQQDKQFKLYSPTEEYMKKPFIFGVIGGILGLVAAFFIIITSPSNEYTLAGVQAALFSSMGLMGAAITSGEPKFAGWMLVSSAVWILITAPLAGTFTIMYLYAPAIICLGAAGAMALFEQEPDNQTL